MPRFAWLILALAAVPFAWPASLTADDLSPTLTPEDQKRLAELPPVMLDVTERDAPSDEEWQALQDDEQRAGWLGSLSDFRSRTIAFMNTRYFTANPADGTLAAFGKMADGKQFDRYGHIDGVEFALDKNSWRQRHVVNASALFQLAGSRFMEYAGLGVSAALDNNRQFEVTFIGTTVPKDEAIRRLNHDVEALEYLEVLARQRAEYEAQTVKLFSKAPPEPKVVLANVVMLDGRFAKALDAAADGKLHSRILDDSVELSVKAVSGEQVTLLSPVVRCYRTYSIQFKKGPNGRLERVERTSGDGQTRRVVQIFDLTPDL